MSHLTRAGGLELAVNLDLLIAGESVKLGFPEVRRPLGPDGADHHRCFAALSLLRAACLVSCGSAASASPASSC